MATDVVYRKRTFEQWKAILVDEDSAREILSALTEPDGRNATKAADAQHVRAEATRRAKVWIRVTQAQIHVRMGEESAGTSTMMDAMELFT